MDVQFILAMAQNATTWYWSVSSNGDIFLQWIEALASTQNPPLVHSMSYASLAPEDPKYDVERFNTEMCKLGLKGSVLFFCFCGSFKEKLFAGLTLFVASGDDGVANFGARNSPSQCGFTPSFPATSPVSLFSCCRFALCALFACSRVCLLRFSVCADVWCQYATSVGATQGPEAGSPEIACSSATGGLITTGGGFSTYVKRPDWQDAAVHAYLNGPNNVPPRSMFSSQGRA